MAPSNLQEVLDAAGNPVEHLRNSQLGTYIYPVVPAEFSNWRREQKAWRETAVLYDQSHHMVNVFLKGPDAIKVIERTAINSVANFPVGRAKQYIPTASNGGVIGDGILFHDAEDSYIFVGRAPASNWLKHHAETGGFSDLEVVYDDRSPSRPYGNAGQPQAVALRDPGAERMAGDREAQRRPGRAAQVLPHGDHEDRRRDLPDPAPRHGRRTGPGDLGPV